VLALGTESARKNLTLLDRLAAQLDEAGLDTVIAGSGRSYLRTPAHAARTGARRLGYVEEADLPALYAHAEVLAMPSFYEGFGLPCIEAMACGTPVVAADRAALPEACGGAALLADPEDEDAFAAALIRAAGPERERLTEAGRTRAAGLTWARSAESADAAIGALL
jgi:glycosyltransferase involved in cell wall biosynthesis